MALTKPIIGQASWGQPLNTALDYLDSQGQTAQATADSASTAANAAQSTANSAQTAADSAVTTANNAQTTADSAIDTNYKAAIRNSGNGTWPARPTNTVVMWIETQSSTPQVPPGMTNGDYYIGPDGMAGLAPGGTP